MLKCDVRGVAAPVYVIGFDVKVCDAARVQVVQPGADVTQDGQNLNGTLV